MFNIAFVVVVLLKIIRITYGDGLTDLSSGLGGIGTALNVATGSLFAAAADLSASLGVQSLYIPGVGDIGTVALAVDTLCRTPIVNYMFCPVCHLDCLYVHNTYGGICSQNPYNTTEKACMCAKTADEATSRNISYSPEETCKNWLPSPIPDLQDVVTLTVLLSRMNLVLCPMDVNGKYESSGCKTDCTHNHGARGGSCAVTVPRNSKSGTNATLHCECCF